MVPFIIYIFLYNNNEKRYKQTTNRFTGIGYAMIRKFQRTHSWKLSQLTWDYKELIFQAIYLTPEFMKYIGNLNEKDQLATVQQNWEIIKYI